MEAQRILEKLAAYEPPQEFVPFQIEYHLATPLMMGYPWIFGDGLLARQLMIELLGDEFYNLPAKTPLSVWKYLKLPVKQTGDIYHASASILDTDEKHTTIFYKRFHEAPDLKTKTRIRMNSGQLRNFMLKFPYSASQTVKFNFMGNEREVARLMGSIRHIGKKHAAGGGEIASMKVQRLQKDESIIKDGIAMRSIPAKMLKEMTDIHVMLMAYRFPSWDNANICLCVAPGGKCEI
jgi:hypothetical protein